MSVYVFCMYIKPEDYSHLPDIAERLMSLGIRKNIILYIHEDDIEPETLADIFIVHRYKHYLGRITALYAAITDFPNATIISITEQLIADGCYLKLLLSYIDIYNTIISIKGYELNDYCLRHINDTDQQFIFGSIPDVNCGCILPPNILNAAMFDVDYCKHEFGNCEVLYFAYLLMKHSLPVTYVPGAWRITANEPLMDSDDIDTLQRSIIKLYYLISSEELYDRNTPVPFPSINVVPVTEKHNHPLYYISFTSFGKRNRNIKLVIDQLKRQKHYIYAINLWIVNDEYTQDELKELRSICNGFIDIKILDKPLIKYKSYNKMIHQLTDLWYSRFHTLTIDDDILYPDDFIKCRLETARLCDYRIPCSGSGFDADAYANHAFKRYKHGGLLAFNNIIEGFAGIWYPAGVFSDIERDVLLKPDIEHFSYADDIFISYLMRKLNIPTYYSLDMQDPLHRRALPFIDALHVENNGENGCNIRALNHFRDQPMRPIVVINITDKHVSFKRLYNMFNSAKDNVYMVVRLDKSLGILKNKIHSSFPRNVCVCTDIPVRLNGYIDYKG